MVNFPVSGALIGRAGELAALLDAVGSADTRTVLIAGEAGVGKSRLLGEFTRRLDGGTLVLTGRCPEFGTDGVAFAPFLAVLRGLLRELGVAELAALLPAQPALANWLPQLAVHTGTSGPGSDRIRLFGEILTVIEQLAMARPVVLVLEDLHWADAASRELLTFLVTNLADGEVLLVGTYRPGAAGPLRGLVAELRRHPGVLTLDIEPLTRHEVGRQLAALLGREPEASLITRVFERSGGNPLFVEALGHAPEQLPVGLTDLLLGFQTGLTPAARSVLQVAAVIGSPIRHELLAEAVDLPRDTLHDALRELVDRQLLLTTDTGYEFRHVLIRQAIYDAMLPIERTQLHERLANVLYDSPSRSEGHDSELAHHASAAGNYPRALLASWSAAEASTAEPERLRQLERVLDLWDQVPDAEHLLSTTKVALLEQITESATATGAIDRGIASATAALDLIDPAADPTRAAHLYRRRAGLRGVTGAGPGDDITHALALLPSDPPSLERAEALALFAITNVFAGDPEAAATAAHDALLIADHFDAPHLTAQAHAYLALAAAARTTSAPNENATQPATANEDASGSQPVLGMGDGLTRPAPASNEVAPQPSTAPDDAPELRPDASNARANQPGAYAEGRREVVVGHFAAARAVAEAAGDDRVLLDVLTWESAVLVAEGEYRAAITVVQQGLRVAQESFRFAESGPILLVKWVQALSALGRWGEARAVVDDAQFEQLPPLSRAALLVSYGRIAVAQGDTDTAGAQAARAEELLGDGRWALVYRLQLQVLRGLLALEVGDRQSAAEALARAWALADAAAEPLAQPSSAAATPVANSGHATATLSAHPHDAWPLVALAVQVGDGPEGLVALGDSLPCTSPVDLAHRADFTAWNAGGGARWDESARAWRALEQPYEEARSLLSAAEAYAAEGDRETSAVDLRAGAELATRLGAEPLVAVATRLAKRARVSLDGVAAEQPKTQGGNPSGQFGLTPRELDVLRLVAKGLSNRALATELFISANTAGVHVSRILAKLGVATRTEAAAFAHEHGLLG